MELTKQATHRTGRDESTRRAVGAAVGRLPYVDDPCDRLHCSRGSIDSKRIAAEGVAGLLSRHRGQGASALTPRLEARILEWTATKAPADGWAHWSTRKLGQALDISPVMESRVWAKHGLQPHWLERSVTQQSSWTT